MAIGPSGQWLAGIGLVRMTMRSGREFALGGSARILTVLRVESRQGAILFGIRRTKKPPRRAASTRLWDQRYLRGLPLLISAGAIDTRHLRTHRPQIRY